MPSITGSANERDRRVVLIAAPRFGIVGQSQTISFKVEDEGVRASPAEVKISRDGEIIDQRVVGAGPAGRTSGARFPMPARTSSRSRRRRSRAN